VAGWARHSGRRHSAPGTERQPRSAAGRRCPSGADGGSSGAGRIRDRSARTPSVCRTDSASCGLQSKAPTHVRRQIGKQRGRTDDGAAGEDQAVALLRQRLDKVRHFQAEGTRTLECQGAIFVGGVELHQYLGHLGFLQAIQLTDIENGKAGCGGRCEPQGIGDDDECAQQRIGQNLESGALEVHDTPRSRNDHATRHRSPARR
jgi:hypothetical protein